MPNDANTMPHELDLDYYSINNADLSYMGTSELINHFYRFGIPEGRAGSAAALRENFLKLVSNKWTTLEIGPFFNPSIEGPHVKYFDVFDQIELRRRAVRVGVDPDRCPPIHYVSPTGDLSTIGEMFDCVVSSHCIEHQPDLVAHLNNVHDLLVPGGRYFILIPDKRYCFDRYLPESNIAGVIDAHIRKRQRHEPKDILSHLLLKTHNDSQRHWLGDHGRTNLAADRSIILDSIRHTDRHASEYIDTHAWQFTPDVFREILSILSDAQLCALNIERVYNSPFGRNEFTAILRRQI